MSFTWCLTYSRLCVVTCGSEPRACSQRGSRGCGGAHVVAWVGSRPLARPGARPEAGLGWRPRKAAALRGALRVVGEPPPLGPPGPAPFSPAPRRGSAPSCAPFRAGGGQNACNVEFARDVPRDAGRPHVLPSGHQSGFDSRRLAVLVTQEKDWGRQRQDVRGSPRKWSL